MIIKPCPICGAYPKFIDNSIRFHYKNRKPVYLFGCPNGCRVVREGSSILKPYVKFEGRKVDYDSIFQEWNERVIDG